MTPKQTPKPRPNRGGSDHGSANRAARSKFEMATKQTKAHRAVTATERAAMIKSNGNKATIFEEPKLKITHLGGQDGIGNKNMIVIEYGQDALVIDAGNNLGVDLPGINYTIPDISYLESIKHKVKGYIFTHGHLDHIGAVQFVLPQVPAPVYGTQFTLGMVQKQFETDDFTLQKVVLNSDNHDRVKIGVFMVESVRITHSIPDCSFMVIDTPLGRIIHTGDFRLDPEPLDRMPTDIQRIKQLGQEGVLLLFADSTNAQVPGRTPTEFTLKQSFHDLIAKAPGRVIVAVFSSNMNRVQMIVDAAVASGRKVAVDGRSMLAAIELAVRLGYVKIPKGTIVPIRNVSHMSDQQVLVVCTGGQGEENASLVRMSTGEHQHVQLKREDSVVISSTPIPGNEISYARISDNLAEIGVHLYRAPTVQVDGCGPLHVSGHGAREEMADMLQMLKPQYFIPVHAGHLHRRYHQQIAIAQGLDENRALMVDNGDVIEVGPNAIKKTGSVPTGAQLVDQTGALVPDLVVHDRILMGEDGIVVVVLTLERKGGGRSLSSPDIITRGFIYIKDNEQLMNELRNELRRFTIRRFNKVELTRFKQELRDHINSFLFKHTERSPIIIPVVNIVGNGGEGPVKNAAGSSPTKPGH